MFGSMLEPHNVNPKCRKLKANNKYYFLLDVGVGR